MMGVLSDEIYLVELPFSDNRESKKRPVVVLSSDRYNAEEPDVIVCGITTNADHDWFLSLGDKELVDGKLYPGSGVRIDMIGRVDKQGLKARIGKIKASAHRSIVQKLNQIIG